MSEHTPGPWSVIYGPSGNGPHRIEADAPASVAMVSGMGQDGAANARLIAAAPDLLDLLRQLRDEWFEPHYGQNDIGMAALLRDKIRAAIAKAESGGK